jgi:hypothetical protein
MTKPLPTNKERWRLQGKLQKAVDKLHGKDADGDRYAKVEVLDRRDGQWPYVRAVPRVPWENPTPEQLLAAIDAAGSNVESTARMFDQVRRDVQAYFEIDKRGRAIRAAVKAILGETAIVGRAYDRHDDAPRWCRWEPYKNLHAQGSETPTVQTCFFNDVNGFDSTAFKTWLKAGKQMLVKAHGKRIKGWYVRTDGSIGTSLSALVEIPEKERPYHTARNRAKREFLERHAEAIECNAKRIEAELRAKKG